MHGRLKVRSTDEEKERKKKEQTLKVKAYRAAMTKIQAKRTKQELDDEMLTLTAQILLRNPDVATLWNIRRECILKKSQDMTEDAAKQQVFDGDLGLTEQCLMVNPKSYGGWHQRCWVLENCPQANWERELLLCNKYLKLDERNFHTWDYRRFVVAKAGVGKQQELDFCTERIKVNFSNYSSWHYRSQLLPVLYPYQGNSLAYRPMSEDKLKEELEMVLTAAFTDPNDSSAWFYQRWLLGNSLPELDVCAFRMNEKLAVLSFTKPITRQQFKLNFNGNCNNESLNALKWQPLQQSLPNNTIWVAALSTDKAPDFATITALILEINLIDDVCAKQLKLVACTGGLCYFKPPNHAVAFSAGVINELETQLESCNSLLEFEPDSKWTLLTSSLLMRAIDCKRYHNKSLEYLQKLQKVDALREGYYKDLASKWMLENILQDWQTSLDFPAKLDLTQAEHLSTIYYGQYLCIADAVELPAAFKNSAKNSLQSFQKLLL